MSPTDKQLREYTKKLREMVHEHGWVVQGIFPAEQGDLGFSYTVGMTEAGLPELVLSGLFGEQAKELLNIAAQIHLKNEMKHGDTTEDVANVPLRVIDAPEAEVNMARNLYGRQRVRAVQLVWPDPAGLFPGSIFGSQDKRQELFGQVWW